MKIVVQGWVGFPHSICMVNMKHIKAWLENGHDVYFHSLAPLHSFWKDRSEVLRNDGYYRKIYQEMKEPSTTDYYDVLVSLSVPLSKPLYRARKSVIFIVAEYNRLTSAYMDLHGGIDQVKGIVSEYDEVVTPSQWSAEALKESDILGETKIRVIPHGVDNYKLTSFSALRDRLCKSLSINASSKILLCIGPYTFNKGIDQLLTIVANSNRKDITVITKNVDAVYKKNKSYLDLLKAVTKSGIQIRYVGDSLTEIEMLSLLAGSDAYCSLFRAEGFNLPVAQALSLGIPVYATSAPPIQEYTSNSSKEFLVDCQSILGCINGEMLRYFEVNMSDASNKLGKLLDHLDKGCREGEYEASKYGSRLCSWNEVSHMYLN